MEHTTSINIFLIIIAVLFIGGLVLIGRRSSAVNRTSTDSPAEKPRRPF